MNGCTVKLYGYGRTKYRSVKTIGVAGLLLFSLVAARADNLSAKSRRDGVLLTWSFSAAMPNDESVIYASTDPSLANATQIGSVRGAHGTFLDSHSNWQLEYYRVDHLSNRGVYGSTNVVGGISLGPDPWAGIETFSFWYEPWSATGTPDPTVAHTGKGSFVVVNNGTANAADMALGGLTYCSYTNFYTTVGWINSRIANPTGDALNQLQQIAFYDPSLSQQLWVVQ